MSALQSIQKLLPIDASAPAPETSLSFDELSKVAHQLIQHTRFDAFRHASTQQSLLQGLSSSDLDSLTRQFESHQQSIAALRQKLGPIDLVLNSFSQELHDLASTLTLLQDQSSQLSSDLHLQRSVTDRLNPLILDLAISPETVRLIINDKVDAQWVENIRFINEKAQLVDLANYENTRAQTQLKEAVDLLTAKAVERVRDFIISSIKQLRLSTRVSSQKVQNDLLQVKEAFVFLRSHEPTLASQLQLAYIYTMRWYYHVRFAKYLYALEKLHLRTINHTFVLGGEEDKSRSWVPSASTSQTHKISLSEYLSSIDQRIQCLDEKPAAIPSQIAETTPFHYWIEFVFQQWLVALVDNVVVEYLFMVEFFYQGNEKFDVVDSLKDWPHVMFENIYKMGSEFVTWLVSHQQPRTSAMRTVSHNGTYDAYAVLIMVRLIQASQNKLHNEIHIPVLDDHLNSLLLVLWPHFTKIVDYNCESMKKVVMKTHKSKDAHLAPVSVTQQFTHFLLGLLKLAKTDDKNKDHYKGEPLFISVNRLRNDFESVLTKLANHLFTSKSQTAQKELFLYNNYFLVVSILKNENGDNAIEFITDQISHFEMLCQAYETK